MVTAQELGQGFKKIYGRKEGLRFFFAPGRVNLIGEHIDYSGGHVFPCAVDFGTFLALGAGEDGKLRGFSENFPGPGILEVDMEDTSFREDRGWFNYVAGVLDTLKVMGFPPGPGFDLYIGGEIPPGAGLSSSASLEMAAAFAFNEAWGLGLDKPALAEVCHRAENEYIGVRCGIMDQFAVGLCQRDHALLLDCRNLAWQHVPLNLGDKALVIINSREKRALVDSAYNRRRESCEEALGILKRYRAITHLCDIDAEEFESLKGYIRDEEVRKRARHAVGENARVLQAVEALQAGRWERLGSLMEESHRSLKEDYEVSTGRLDLLSELALGFEGCFGARMTGAGFGGCTVNIVEKGKIEGFIRHVSRGYLQALGAEADFYVTGASDGVREIME